MSTAEKRRTLARALRNLAAAIIDEEIEDITITKTHEMAPGPDGMEKTKRFRLEIEARYR